MHGRDLLYTYFAYSRFPKGVRNMQNRFLGCLATLLLAAIAIAAETPTRQENPPPGKATYVLVPVKGVIGEDFTADLMEAFLQQGKRLAPTVFVLEIDTPGGSTREAEAIIDKICAHKEVRCVAFVHNAISAGAAITLACRDIYMTDDAKIGGAVSFAVGSSGIPRDVGEKMQSIWRAVCRKAAEGGDHPSLIAEAMVDPEFELTMRKEGDKVVVERNGAGKVLKAKGRILTLTAKEAVSCELAKGIVANIDELGTRLSLTGWQNLGAAPPTEPAPPNMAIAISKASSFYSILYHKVEPLKEPSRMTSLQIQKAVEQCEDLVRKQALNQQVKWTVEMIEARDRQIVVSETPPVVRNMVEYLREYLAGAEYQLDKAKLQLQKALQQAQRPNLFGSSPETAQEMVKDCQKKVDNAKQLLIKAVACPVVVYATAPDEPRLLITAFVTLAARDEASKIPPGGSALLSGSILGVEHHIYEDGTYTVIVRLDKSRIRMQAAVTSEATVTGSPTAVGEKEADRECRAWLQLADNFVKAGQKEKAREYLKKIIETYPGTTWADKAKDRLTNQ